MTLTSYFNCPPTSHKQLIDFARAGLSNPELVRLDTDTKVSENLKLAFFFSRTQEKAASLLHLVREVLPKDDHTIVFAATRHHVEYVSALLRQDGVAVSVAYGSMGTF
jgi:ATP-dependent RNA helicase DDX54/DBP10